MKLVEYLNSVDIDTIAEIEKRFAFGISPVTRNKVLSKIENFREFYSNVLSGYDDNMLKILINSFFEGHSCGVEYAVAKNEKEFFVGDLWGYLTEREQKCRFVFFKEALLFLKEHLDSLISSQTDNLDDKELFRVDVLSFIESFILMLGTGKYRALKGGANKAVIDSIIEKTGYTNKFFIKFVYGFLFDQGIIKEDSNSHIVTDIVVAQTWNKIDNFTKIETVINYMCSKYVASLFNKKNSICASLASYMFFPSSPSFFSVEKTAHFLKGLMDIQENVVADFFGILENSEFLIKKGDFFVKNEVYKFFTKQDNSVENIRDDLFYVQPNFEIIISFMCESEVSLYLSRFAELVSYDRAVIFKITKKSFTRAVSSGMKSGDIITFIKEKSRNPVPENVVFNLKEWEKEVVSITVENVNVIRFEDDFLRDKITALDEMSGQIIGKIADNCFKIKDIDAVNEILFKNGYFSESSTRLNNENSVPFSEAERVVLDTNLNGNKETILPKFAKKFERSQRLCSLSQEEKIKAFKYAMIKDLKVEFIYWYPQDKQLHNKKYEAQVFEVSNSWKNPEVYVYVEDLKRNYNLTIANIKRMRIVL